MPFNTDEIQRQVEPIPTNQRKRQRRVDHATKYTPAEELNSEFGIRNAGRRFVSCEFLVLSFEFPPTHPNTDERVRNSKLKTKNSNLT
jgi:hypothetical protein